MGTVTIIKRDGRRYNVTTDPNKRTTIMSSGSGSRDSAPAVINRSTGRRSNTAIVEEIKENEEQTAVAEVNFQARKEEEQPKQLSANTESSNNNLLLQQQYSYVADGGVNQGTQIINTPPKINFPTERQQGTYEPAPKPPAWFNVPVVFRKEKPKAEFNRFGIPKIDYEEGVFSPTFKRVNYEITKFEQSFNPESDEQIASQLAGGFLKGVFNIADSIVNYPTTLKSIYDFSTNIDAGTSAVAQELARQKAENPRGLLTESITYTFLPEAIGKGAGKLYDLKATRGATALEKPVFSSEAVITEKVRYPSSKLPPSEIQKAFYGKGTYENVGKVKTGQFLFDESSPLYSPINNKKITNIDEATSYLDEIGNAIKNYQSDKPLSFSASPQPIKGDKILTKPELIEKGLPTSETEGLFTGVEVIPNYFKLGGGSDSSGIKFSLLPKFNIAKPTATIIRPKSVELLPRGEVAKAQSLPKSEQLSYLNKVATKTVPEGSSFISAGFELGKGEVESIFKAGSFFEKTPAPAGEFYTRDWFGRRVPNPQYTAVEVINPLKPPSGVISAEELGVQLAKEQAQIVKSSKASETVNIDFGTPIFNNLKEIPSSIKPSTVKGSSNLFDPSNIMVLQPATQTPSSSFEYKSGEIKIPSSRPSGSLGKNRFVSSTILFPESYPIIPPSPSGGGGGSSSRSSGSSSNIFVPPPSIIPPSDSSGGSGGSSSGGGGSSSTIPPPSSSSIFGGGSSTSGRPSRSSYPPPPSIVRIFPSLRSKKRQEQAFDVYARRKGIFRKVNPFPLTKQSAINFGTYKVGSDSTATFKLQPVFGKAKVQPKSGKIENFYRKRGLFIEKKEKRIKRTSPKELQEITFKGIASNKGKKKSKKKQKSIFGGVIKWR